MLTGLVLSASRLDQSGNRRFLYLEEQAVDHASLIRLRSSAGGRDDEAR